MSPLKLKIAITGSHGFVGSALIPFLESSGHKIIRIPRSPQTGLIDLSHLENVDAVIHLAGENIAAGRWTGQKKNSLRNSRIENTRLLCTRLAQLTTPPKVLLSASATGIYGNRGDEILTEQSKPGRGFLADLACAWEAACEPARKAGIRVVNLRFGMILSPDGGALQKMLKIFRLGLGGPLGSGKQWISWVSMADVLGAINNALMNPKLSGPINVVSPNPVTNKEFTRTLGHALSRPALLPAPAWALRLALGEMADQVLLSSQRVLPDKLIHSGYQFTHSNLLATFSAIHLK